MKKISRRKTRQTLKPAKVSKRPGRTKSDVPHKVPARPFAGLEKLFDLEVLGYTTKIRKGDARKRRTWFGEPRVGGKPYQAPNPFNPVVWQGKDLSTDATIMFYGGKCYVRPIGRGVVLSDLKFEPHLDDVLPEGNYEIEIRVVKRLSAK